MILALLLLIGAVNGGWMIFDGVHVLRRGRYFGPPEPGPWRHVARAVGLDPFKLGVPFVILGALWIAAAIDVLLRGPAWLPFATATAAATLWYLPVGTVLSVAWLILLRLL